jgi:two-component system sensor histidine kinase ChiS
MISVALLLITFITTVNSDLDTIYPGGIRFQHIGIEEGLSQSAVRCVFQDSQGFLWFGTSDGLNKYDGYTFKQFTVVPGEDDSIAGKVVFDIIEDHDKSLWVATNNGVTRFNTVNGSATNYYHDPLDEKTISSSNCHNILLDSRNRLWIATSRGLSLYDRSNDSFKRIPLSSQSEQPYGNFRVFEVENMIWALNYYGELSRFNSENMVMELFDYPALDGRKPTFIYEDFENIIFGCRGNDIVTIEKASASITVHDIPGVEYSRIAAITKDQIGRYWAAATDGSVLYLKNSESDFKIVGTPQNSVRSDRTIALTNLFIDRSGVIWITTNGNGLYSYSPYRNKFLLFNNTSNANIRTNGYYIYSILKEGDYLWLGCGMNGLERVNLATGESESIPLLQGRGEPNYSYSSLFMDDRGFIWFLPAFNTSYRINKKTLSIKAFPTEKLFSCFYQASSGEILACRADGVIEIFDSVKTLLIKRPVESKRMPLKQLTTIAETDSGLFWIGTVDGLIRWDRSEQQMKVYRHHPEEENALPNNNIKKILVLRNGGVAFATMGGLAFYNEETDDFTSYTVADGLPNDSIYSLEEDNSGLLWLSTNKGLICFSPSDTSITLFRQGDGLQSNEFNSNSSFLSDDGQLFFGGINGVSAFYPDKLIFNNSSPQIAYTSIELMGKEVTFDVASADIPLIETDYRKNYFSFRFAALDFTNPSQNQYKYRIEGINDSYQSLGTERSLNIELSPGNYLLQVAGTNSDGIWSENDAMLRIIVHPPFWENPVFITMAILFLAGLVALVFLYNNYQSKRMQQILETEVAAKTRALENTNRELESFNYMVSHDLQSPLMNLSHYVQLIRENLSDSDDSSNKKALEKISSIILRTRRLIRDLLYFSRSNTMHIDRSATSLSIICLECVNEARESNPASTIKFEGQRDIMVHADADLLKIAVKNIINNSVKFAPDPQNINISLKESAEDGCTVFRISDNGRTIPESNGRELFKPFRRGADSRQIPGTGIGLAIVERVIERHNGSVWLEKTPGGGVTVAFKLGETESDA